MMKIIVQGPTQQALDQIAAQLDPKTFSRAAKYAAIQSAYDGVKAIKAEMQSSLDRPKPFTLNSIYVNTARRSGGDASAVSIEFRDRGGKHSWPAHYLIPQALGGDRSMKRFERAIARTFGLGNIKLIPSAGAPEDAFGNVPGSFITRMLTFLRADQSGTQNRGAKARTRNKTRLYYLVKGGKFLPDGQPTTLADGIYEKYKTEKNLVQVFHFADDTQYRQRFKFYETARATVDRVFASYLSKYIERGSKQNPESSNRI